MQIGLISRLFLLVNYGKWALCVGLLGLSACEQQAQKGVDVMAKQSETAPAYARVKQLAQPAPLAKRMPSEREYHGETLADPYFWLKDADYPKVDDKEILSYLEQENSYYAAFLEPHKPLVNTLFEEFKGRTDETEESVPYIENGYEYRWYFREGKEYRTYSRKNLQSGKEEVFLDVAALAEGHDYFVLGGWSISPDNTLLAYAFDTNGNERYQLRIKNLVSGEYLPEVLEEVSSSAAFSSDGRFLLYSKLEKDRWYSKQIKIHRVGEAQEKDRTLYEEQDDGFFIGFGLTSSKQYFVISARQADRQESYIISSSLSGPLQKIVDREQGFQHSIDHAHGHFYILANDSHPNFRLARAPDKSPGVNNWQTLIEGDNNNYLIDMQTFDKFFALKQRKKGLEKISLLQYPADSDPKGKTNPPSMASRDIALPEQVYTVGFGVNPEFVSDTLRLTYTSMITPNTIFDYGVNSGELQTRKVAKIPSGYDKTQYVSERLMLPSRDGVEIPCTVVYKKGFKKDGSQPLWLYGYGAYSATISPRFSSLRLSALDRGFAFAVAHVRGGSMLGYQWYLDGKLKKRSNTFNDFVDVARGLIKKNYVSPGNISISGRSAGGELMGAVTLQAPELWRSVNLGVPFVDVLNTMLDASLPLTPPEWKEWGNPITSATDYALIKSYSPYDNIRQQAYPPMFVSGGLNDPRVTYWEPAKWTAKMRHMKSDNNLLVMRMNMGAGHFANSGRYGRLKDYAEEYAFMLLAHGIEN